MAIKLDLGEVCIRRELITKLKPPAAEVGQLPEKRRTQLGSAARANESLRVAEARTRRPIEFTGWAPVGRLRQD